MHARLDGANLAAAILTYAILDYADLKGAILTKTNLKGTNLRYVQNLTQVAVPPTFGRPGHAREADPARASLKEKPG